MLFQQNGYNKYSTFVLFQTASCIKMFNFFICLFMLHVSNFAFKANYRPIQEYSEKLFSF